MSWIHIVGAGGIAMSAIANCFIEQGVKITGSDLTENELVQNLRNKGAEIYIGHKAENIESEIDKVIYSDAVPDDNVELKEAKAQGIESIGRSEALALLTAGQTVISASGTHGKTTTSSLIANLLTEGELDPSFIIGGILNNFDSNYRAGTGNHFVLEGDEYGRSFLKYPSNIGVVTNIEFDHPDIYSDLDDMIAAYQEYIDGLDQLLVTNREVLETLNRSKSDLEAEIVTVGINDSSADYTASNIYSKELTSYFNLEYKGKTKGEFQISALGNYNVKHALEALAVGRYCGISFADLKKGLRNWKGVKRRFEVIDRSGDQIVITDYAHHPQEVKAVVSNLEKIKTNKDKVVIFQPHQYLRTKSLFSEYQSLLEYDVDKYIIYQIYKVREQVETEELNDLGRKLSNIISSYPVEYYNEWEKLEEYLDDYAGANGTIHLFLGAGNIDEFARKWVKN